MQGNIKRANTIEYIEYGLNNKTMDSKKSLGNSLNVMLMFSIPILIFGKWFILTLVFIVFQLSLLLIFNQWIKKDIERKRIYFLLYKGLNSIFISEILMLSAWKLITTVYEGKLFISIILILIYIVPILLIILDGINKINKGLNKKSSKYISWGYALFGGMGAMGMAFGKSFFKEVSQDTAMIILAILLIILAVMFSLGWNLVLKYYLCKKFNISSQEIKDK